ncbi:MAG: hypothetical protein CVV44_08385 [Spirochaetae bacterium HGW-Spirochaetae-1]|jgi:hypothetical protein|nr:MAG: hypothetical protein CVV44_08385 [Spirochaetae bacterium HGW-Spirochaetae-1]
MDEFRVCATCGYSRGFHISFKKAEQGFSIIFICPDCGSSYDLALTETGIIVSEPLKGLVFEEHENQS